MGYLSFGKKLLICCVMITYCSISGYKTAKGVDISPREQAFLLSPKKTYEYYCSPCHGMKGKGDGTFFTIDLKPKPRNFTDAEYMKKRTDDQLIKSITDGSKAVDKSNLCPPWGKVLTEKRIKELAMHIRSFSLQEEEKPLEVKQEAVVEDTKKGVFRSSMRWLFLIVITMALAIGAIGEWKKFKKESLSRQD